MKFTENVVQKMDGAKFGNRSFTQTLLKIIREERLEYEVADIILETAAIAVMDQKSLSSVAGQLTKNISRFVLFQGTMPGPKGEVTTGINFLDMAQDFIMPMKHDITDGYTDKEMWFLTSTSEEFTEWAKTMKPTKQVLDATLGAQKWTGPVLRVNEYDYEIVRKARRYGVLHWYRHDKMPAVYDALNRLGSTEWVINPHMLELFNMDVEAGEKNLIPPIISDTDRIMALANLNSVKRTAKYVEELRFEEYHKWAQENELAEADKFAEKRSKQDAEDWELEKSFDHKEVISAWSKRMDFDKTVAFANDYYGSELNFTYNCDTRGRVYAIHPYLNPQGSDVAKSLLMFANPKQISSWDLFIHIANCFGQDKGSFEDRVNWVKEREQQLVAFAHAPWEHWDFIEETKLGNEKKTKFQAIAACIELAKFHLHLEQFGTDSDFLCAIPIGLDATSSGVQILTAIGRDHKAAEHVNLTATRDGKVGDLYQYVWNEGVVPELPKLTGKSKELDVIIEKIGEGHKLGRDMVKRPAMTYSYSATLQGMGEMYYSDRKNKDSKEERSEWSYISVQDAKALGRTTYYACEAMLEQSAKLMRFMRDGVKYHKGGAIISWTLPDGFKAFQCKDKSGKVGISCTLAGVNVNLSLLVFKDKPHLQKHQNAISPDMVHSLDAYLLREMARRLPAEANLHFIHDSFGTDSWHVGSLQEIAKDIYTVISNRDTFKAMCDEAFGEVRDLPTPGEWEVEQIYTADFVIC